MLAVISTNKKKSISFILLIIIVAMKNVLILPRLANDQEYIVSLCGDLEINYTPKLFM